MTETEVLDSIFREIHRHSVELVFENEKTTHGSGTLVCLGNNFGILTARHVTECLRNTPAGEIGVTISDRPHRFILDVGSYSVFELGRPGDDSGEGPDLALVLITRQTKIDELAARKHFYPLQRQPHEAETFDFRTMPWAFSGAPRELGELRPAESRIDLSPTRGGAELVVYEFSGEFDYVTLSVHRERYQFPKNYGGVSGGGLWVLPTRNGPDGWSHDAPILGGVVFAETEISKDQMQLRGHGPASIQRVLVDRLVTHFGG